MASGPIEPVVGEYLLKYLPATSSAATPAVLASPLAPALTHGGPAQPVPMADGGPAPSDVEGQRPGFMPEQGDFPVRITAIETESLPPVGSGAAQTLGQLTVRVHCTSTVAVEHVKFGFELINDQGQVAIHVYGPDQVPYFKLVKGHNSFVGVLPQLTLMPGDYRVCVGVLELGSEAILGMRGWEEPGEPLRVLPDFQNDLLGAIARNALVPAAVNWQLSAGDAAAVRCTGADARPDPLPAAALRAA